MMPDAEWYYAKDDQQLGPVSTAELKKLADDGRIAPDDLVWCDQMDGWAPARTRKDLFAPRRARRVGKPSKTAENRRDQPAEPPPDVQKPSGDAEWYYSNDEQQLGPVSAEELKALAARGVLDPDDLVWCDQMDDWAPASSRSEIFPKPPEPQLRADDPSVAESGFAEPDLPSPEPPAPDFDIGPPEEPLPPESDETFSEDEMIAPPPIGPSAYGAAPPVMPTGEGDYSHYDFETSRRRSSPPFVPLAMWGIAILVVLVGGGLFAARWFAVESDSERASTAALYVALLAAVYVLARAAEGISRLLK